MRSLSNVVTTPATPVDTPPAQQAINRVAHIIDAVMATTARLSDFNDRTFGLRAAEGGEKGGPTPVPSGWLPELEMKLDILHGAVARLQAAADRTCEIG